MSEFDVFFEKLLEYYEVVTINELAKKINTGPSTISNWRQRKSINALKKKCRELGIYKEIFGEINKRSVLGIAANHFNVNSAEEVIKLLQDTKSELKRTQNEWMMNTFGEEIVEILKTAATVMKDEKKKESFKNQIKKWIVENL
uniref:hypothetical protein n=1 Tax=Aliarcobacter sp. TaxID=2321116 RepID=UPI004047894C